MININLSSLIQRLHPIAKVALEDAAALAVSEKANEVQIEHYLLSLLERPNSDFDVLLSHFDCSENLLRQSVRSTLDTNAKGNGSKPVFSALLIEWLQESWLVSSLDLSETQIRSGALLLTLVSNPLRYGQHGYASILEAVNPDSLKRNFAELTSHSIEAQVATSEKTQAREDGSALSKFTTDFTGKARKGEIDPVFCRDQEIRQIVDILARRRKNNPIAVGEPGVGKTAVVEGLALKIVQGDVPDNLKGVELYGLDMGLLQAGASVKGEFEKRLNAVLDEVKNSPTPIILFIDEAHTLVGGGNQAGGSDAANLLKPALARGEVKTIAATTWSEYKKYFEKDPALARRFQLVKLDEPSPEQAALIIRGLRPAYEKSHNVYVRDDAITAAAALSARYISGRQLPDKAIDVLDTACARVNISLNAIPASVETLQQELAAQQRELEALERDALQQTGDKHSLANIPDLKLAMETTKEELAEQEAQWHKEKEQIQEMIALRSRLHELVFGKVNEEELVAEEDSEQEQEQDVSPYTEMDEEAVRIAISACQEQLDAIRNGNPLVHFEVGPDEVSHVISDWTGIPMGKMLQDEAETTLKLKESLTQSIKGQEYAIDALSEGIQTAKAGLGNPDAPTGVFLLVGPSGVGKTETARAIADQMFGGERFMTTINMSEFQEKHTVSRLIGSPPGYVGYGEGGMLTEAVRQRPYSVVLLDEVEKADPEVLNLFYQVFDKGTLNDGEGRTIDFKNTLIIMTSNLATHEIESLVHQSKDIDANIIAEAIRPTLNQHFKPALLARMSVLPFVPLSDEAMTEIIHHKLNKVSQRLHSHHKLSLNYEESLVEFVLGNCRLAETGARNIDAVINRQLLPQLSTQLLVHDKDDSHTQITVSVDEQGTLTYAFS
ncbi:type VI secretion system ATPase TssH [Vibrio parahaemolyticus]|uniref:type VI secretion system ATPase TssH n=2 Tax=Vibrio parahaemolyticus TaxID=670 RepID=UPI00084AFDD1|nr:type VI secretion system ATPase TssH [Vibrio parahaemolyticus]EJG0874292.1 type VI secretion system ATPase TssH [Vibrio parahaemolyticus O3]EJG0903293.1 type VI secretion system ATPase TssH [Vibrio parahaemolyticus O3:K56]EJG1074980.1 type VI secretion system ATPase TssH [Vibrio parahaemolyticus O1:K56]EGQ8277213.1 type VI secretion system ATPase TssH [Vibrio parahaemolyticus]EGQ8941836.1 type VI secretion system ATPase TssH [Vibrio parahaemolyticus]